MNLVEEARKAISGFKAELSGGLVCLDKGAAEIFHFSIGGVFLLESMKIGNLFDLGNERFLDLETDRFMSDGNRRSVPQRICFILGGFLADTTPQVVRILTAPDAPPWERCTVLCLLSETSQRLHPMSGLLLPSSFEYCADRVRSAVRERRSPAHTPAPDRPPRPASASDSVPTPLLPSNGLPSASPAPSGAASGSSAASASASVSGTRGRAVGTPTPATNPSSTPTTSTTDSLPEAVPVQVLHLPLPFAAFTPSTFFLPLSASLFPSISQGPPQPSTSSPSSPPPSDAAAKSEPNFSVQLSVLAQSLVDTLAVLRLKAEVFCVGPTARLLAREVAAAAKSPMPNSVAASLILVDRTLDLAGCLVESDCVLDVLFSNLPRRADTRLQLVVPAPYLSPAIPEIDKDGAAGSLLGNIFLGAGDSVCSNLVANLLSKPAGVAVNALVRQLTAVLVRHKLIDLTSGNPMHLSTANPAAHLERLLQLLSSRPQLVLQNRALVLLATAITRAMDASSLALSQEMLARDKMLILSAGSPTPSLPRQLVELLSTPTQRGPSSQSVSSPLGTSQALRLASLGFSLLHRDCNLPDEDMADLAKTFERLAREAGAGESAEEEAQHILDCLVDIAELRAGCTSLREVIEVQGASGEGVYRPLLQQIAHAALTDHDNHDIVHTPASLSAFLKTGLGRFVSLSKPRPANSRVVIFFVIGGITFSEIRQLHDLVATINVSQNVPFQVIIGSTNVATPNMLLPHLFTPLPTPSS